MINPLLLNQISTYEAEGILFPIDVLSENEASTFLNRLDETIALMGANPKTENLHQLFLNFKWAYDLATHPKVLNAVESLLGPNLLLWGTSVFAKKHSIPVSFPGIKMKPIGVLIRGKLPPHGSH